MKFFVTIAMLCLAASCSAGAVKFLGNPDGRPSITLSGGANIIGGKSSRLGLDQDRSGMLGSGSLGLRVPTSDDMTISIAVGFDSGVVTYEGNLFYTESKSRSSNISFGGSLTFYL